MADRALGNPLGNPLGLARSTTGERTTIVTIQTNGTFEIPARFNFAILHWFSAGHSGGTYTGGGGGGYAGTKPIKLAGFASRVLTISGNFSCSGLGYVLSSANGNGADFTYGRVGVGGDYNYKGGRGGHGQDGGAYLSDRYGAGGGAAGPSGDGADGAGWILNEAWQWVGIPAGSGASGGGGVGLGYAGTPGSAGGGGGGGIGGGGRGESVSPTPPSQGMGSGPFYAPSMEGGSTSTSTGGAGGLGGGGGGAGTSAPGPGGQFLLVVELW